MQRTYKELRNDVLSDLNDPRHGTSKVVAFSYNCPCEKCKTFIEKLRQEVLADKNHELHGNRTGYVYLGCRCEKCTHKFHKKEYGDRREANWKRIGITDITYKGFLDMLAKQNSKCCVCGKDIDFSDELEHDHKTNKTRGITCHKCNIGISAIEKLQSLRFISYEQQILINQYLQRNSK